jgi:hypothetical protein
VFADPDGKLDGLLFFLEGEVRDGANQAAGRRIFVIYRSLKGDVRRIESAILWDLKPYSKPEAMQTDLPDAEIIAYAVEHVLEPYRAELLSDRERQAEIKRKYGLRSLDEMIMDSEAKLIQYETRRSKGEFLPEMEVLNERRRNEELRARKRALEDEIRAETSLLPCTPKVIGVVRVVPMPAEGEAMQSDAAIEAVGMQTAMEYERAHGRKPEDVSMHNLGYDIRSAGTSGEVRYIEVKARATTGAIVLTPNEWLMAQRLGAEYWLYVVENAASAPVLHTLQNPAATLRPDEEVAIVRYVIKDWKN